MKPRELTFEVDHLVGHPEKERQLSGESHVRLRLGDAVIDGPMKVMASVRGTVDGVHAKFTVGARATLTCVRCLSSWDAAMEVAATQHFSPAADEDGYAISGGEIDLAGPARDELALALPAAPLCRSQCRGLCPICGTDLNTEPCDGHGDDSDSPFSVLKDLFDPDDP